MSELKLWTEEEDNQLTKLVKSLGKKKKNVWRILAAKMNDFFQGRCWDSTQCRERWASLKDSSGMKSNFTLFEEYVFFEAHSCMGNRWSNIAKFLPGKNDGNLKNHFYSNLRKVIRKVQNKKHAFFDIREKIKTFYTLLYIIEHLDQTENSKNDSQASLIEIKQVTRKTKRKDSANQDRYVVKQVKKNGLNLKKIENYLKNLCSNFAKDKFVKDRIFEPEKMNSSIEMLGMVTSLVYYEMAKVSLKIINNDQDSTPDELDCKKRDLVKFLQDQREHLQSIFHKATHVENMTNDNRVFIRDLEQFLNGLREKQEVSSFPYQKQEYFTNPQTQPKFSNSNFSTSTSNTCLTFTNKNSFGSNLANDATLAYNYNNHVNTFLMEERAKFYYQLSNFNKPFNYLFNNISFYNSN